MGFLIDAIQEVIQRKIESGDWIGVPAGDDGYEGMINNINIDSFEVEDFDIDDDEFNVKVAGESNVSYIDADGVGQTERNIAVVVTARVSIHVEGHTSKGDLIVTLGTEILGAER